MLDITASYHCIQFQGKLMNQTWENSQKPSPWFSPNLGHQIFFQKSPPVTRYHGQLLSCTILEKTNDPILRKFSDGWTKRQTDGQTDESDFIGCCQTKVQHPKKQFQKLLPFHSSTFSSECIEYHFDFIINTWDDEWEIFAINQIFF